MNEEQIQENPHGNGLDYALQEEDSNMQILVPRKATQQ